MRAFVFVLVFILLTGCQTTGSFQSIAYKGQQQIVRDGSPSTLSKKRNVVSVSPLPEALGSSSRASFIVAVSNRTNKNISFSPANITATALVPDRQEPNKSEDANDTEQQKPISIDVVHAEAALKSYKSLPHTKTPVKIYNYEELVKEEESRAAMQAFAIALGGIGSSMQASNAGYQSGYGSYNSYSPYGSSYGTYSYSGYDYAAAQAAQNAAQAQTDLEMSNALATNQANLSHLRNTVLKEHTLLPGETHGGLIKLKMPELPTDWNSVPLLLEIKLGNDTHKFLYHLVKNK